jgi:enamine deaminase RidA (YjgF/YER057c/UK114 family)
MMLYSISPKLRSKSGPSAKSRPLHFPGENCAVSKEHSSEVVLTVKPLPGEDVMEIFTRLAMALKEMDARIVHLTVFGSVSASAAGTEVMRRVFGKTPWPVTWVEGAACQDNPIAGLQAFALTGCEVNPIELDGRIVGSVFESDAARHCVLGGLVPTQTSSLRGEQAKLTLDILQKALAQAGFSLADTVRTWFFLDDILSWYDEFNRARTQIYSGVKFHSGSLPVSTGVGARNSSGTALAMSAWAVQSPDGSASAVEVASPLQCPAPAYGSAFSRAMEISSASGRRLFISGTASIATGGQTLWKGDAEQQIALTMEVVEAILHSRGFNFSDVTRATAYFKNRGDVRVFAEWCVTRGLKSLPAVAAQCDVCRDDLLFELEADAWRIQS